MRLIALLVLSTRQLLSHAAAHEGVDGRLWPRSPPKRPVERS